MNDISAELSNSKESSQSISIEESDNKYSNSFYQVCRKCYFFLEAYGSVIAYYGSVVGAVTAALWAPLANEFEGGCKYPYLSEVARSGFGRFLFLCGSILGGIGWIIFSVNYFTVFKQVSNLFLQVITLIFNILSACGMICTAYFDMGHFPMTHMFSVATFAVPLNLLIINNFVDMILYAKQTNWVYTALKGVAFFFSFGGILTFTLLGRINGCQSITLTMEQCLRETAEEVCLSYLSKTTDGYTIIRYYPHCQTMHFWRGFLEYIALLCSAQLLLFLFYDRNTMQAVLMEKNHCIPVNPYILKEIEEQKKDQREDEEKLIV